MEIRLALALLLAVDLGSALMMLGISGGVGQVVPLGVPGVRRIALWRTRAFILIADLPSSLLEVSWRLPSARVRRFPAVLSSSQRRCRGMQRAVDIKTDVFGRLWVLDDGGDSCPAKLLVYDLLVYRLSESAKHVFDHDVTPTEFTIDPGSSRHSTMVYVAAGDQLLAYSVFQDASWRVQTRVQGDITALTVSRGGLYQRPALLLEVNHVDVYRVSTAQLQDSGELDAVELLGQLLGPSSGGIMGDGRGGVMYVLGRDFVALRWDVALPLQAESHDIVLQSSQLLPSVVDLVQDSQRRSWALVNNGTDFDSWCVSLSD